MRKLLTLFFIGFIIMSVNAHGQKTEYSIATNLANLATAKLKVGEIKAADSLIKKSIATYPVYDVIAYCKLMSELPDIVGANIVMKLLKEKVAAMPDKMLIADPLEILMGKAPTSPKEYDKNRAYFNFLNWIYNVNRTYASRPYILESLKDLEIPKIIENVKDDYDFEFNMQKSYKVTYYLYLMDFEAAEKIIESIPITAYNTKEFKLVYKVQLDQLKEDYQSALKKTEELADNKEHKYIADVLFFNIYSSMGDETALDYYKKIDPKVTSNNNVFPYRLAIYYINKKDYTTALSYLDQSNKLRKEKVMMADLIVEGWDFYKAYGDVYAGLNQFDKARDNYKISLLYYPDYKTTNDALAKMETLVGNQISTDKTAPEIAILEPAPNPGLKVVTATAKIMVKGVAKDISGIKEVTINGIKVYAQANGDFWGDVPMKDGINKILVVATDLAGNKAEKSFEIEKSAPSATNLPTPIVAVTEKTGKNYCLLIAAQNYLDTSIPSLNNPVADAIKLKIILKRDYGFAQENVISLFNPTTNDIKRQLLELTNTIQPEDNLVIFYAGHGIWVEKEKKGYWLMTDALYKDTKTWLPNKDVLELIAKLPARNTLLITDACFSGSVFKTRGIPASAPTAIKELASKISRVAITSGNDTEVPDESIFMKYLVKALSENKEKYLTAQKMFINQIMEAVMTETKTEPRYGTLELAGHVGGDYIFTKK